MISRVSITELVRSLGDLSVHVPISAFTTAISLFTMPRSQRSRSPDAYNCVEAMRCSPGRTQAENLSTAHARTAPLS
jgi:hypothetical protein